jgi:hypothetical protein
MSEVQQENTAKIGLPKKTKIATWWLRLMGIVLIILHFLSWTTASLSSAGLLNGYVTKEVVNLYLILFIVTIFYFGLGFSLYRRGKLVWLVIVIISIYSIGMWTYMAIDDALHALGMCFISSVIYFTPLILLMIDRNNYVEMVRQRKEKQE